MSTLTSFLGGGGTGAVVGGLFGAGAGAAIAPSGEKGKGAAVGAVAGAGIGALFGSPQIGSMLGNVVGGLFGGKKKEAFEVDALPLLSQDYYARQGADARKKLRRAWMPTVDTSAIAAAGLRYAVDASTDPKSVDWLTHSQVQQLVDQYKTAPSAPPAAAPAPSAPPVPVQKSRVLWYVLGGVAVLLVAGVVVFSLRKT